MQPYPISRAKYSCRTLTGWAARYRKSNEMRTFSQAQYVNQNGWSSQRIGEGKCGQMPRGQLNSAKRRKTIIIIQLILIHILIVIASMLINEISKFDIFPKIKPTDGQITIL